MDKIVFTLNNTDLHHQYSAMAFTMFEALMQNPQQVAQNFVEELDCFSLKDVFTLHKRIVIQKEFHVAMNEKHVVIYYAVIHFVCWAFVNEAQEDFVMQHFPEDEREDLKEVRDKMMGFAKIATDKIKKDFAKNTKLTAAFKKIAAIDMDEL